jgi:hypothetical protein
MCRPSSDEQIRDIDRESKAPPARRHQMFTNDTVKAEVSYRRERLTRDYQRTSRKPVSRRIVHLFTKNV